MAGGKYCERKIIYGGAMEEGMKRGIGTEHMVCCKIYMEIMLFNVFDTVCCIAIKRTKYSVAVFLSIGSFSAANENRVLFFE